MTALPVNTVAGFTRCAVCKIDLKGRFVFVDKATEQLLKSSAEDLFGRLLIEFVDSAFQPLIDEILQRRNYCETFYDTASLTLLDAEESSIRANVVVSLNFIGGNPTNFQLIINPHSASTDIAEDSGEEEFCECIERLIEKKLPDDWTEVLALTCRFTMAEQAGVYCWEESSLRLLAGAANPVSATAFCQSSDDSSNLHVAVAQSGITYSFADRQSVKSAVERFGGAPNEFVCVVKTEAPGPLLLRLVFRSDLDVESVSTAMRRSSFAVKLLEHCLSAANAKGEAGEEPEKAVAQSELQESDQTYYQSREIWATALGVVAGLLKSVRHFSGDLAHNYFGRLGKPADEAFTRIDRDSSRCLAGVERVRELTGLCDLPEESKVVDLNVLVGQVLEGLGVFGLKGRISCSYESLPKIMVPPARMRRLIEEVMKTAVEASDQKQTRIDINVTSQLQGIRLIFADRGSHLGSDESDAQVDLRDECGAADRDLEVWAAYSGLEHIVHSLGGHLALSIRPGKARKVLVHLPIEVLTEAAHNRKRR